MRIEDLMPQLESMIKQLNRLEAEMPTFKFYDVGYLMDNKVPSSNEISVLPAGTLSEAQGEVEVVVEKKKVEFKNVFDEAQEVEGEISNAVKAKWLPLCSDTVNAPDLRRGERVLLYRYADTDQIYYVPTNLDTHLRRLETKAWLFSADPENEGDRPRSPENSYLFEVSTHKKLITLKTTQLNDEPYSHTFQLNTDTGLLLYEDSNGNKITVDPDTNSIRAENGDGSFADIQNKNIFMNAIEKLHITAGTDVIIDSKKLITNQEELINMNSDDMFKVNANVGVMNVKESLGVNTDSLNVDAKATSWSGSTADITVGKVTFSGTVTMSGAVTMSGSAESTGGFKAGSAEFTKPMTANGITSEGPITGPKGSI
tara:strand:+ start:33549 stop:34661 length:1113 start_codon:yes stop_codon:yes gene_type:complete